MSENDKPGFVAFGPSATADTPEMIHVRVRPSERACDYLAEIARLREENTRLAELALEARWLLEHHLDAGWNEWQDRRRKWLARWAGNGEVAHG